MPNESNTGESNNSVDRKNPSPSVTVKNSNTNAATSTSITSTYENYLALTEKALQKSRESLDTRALIQLAYGDDTAHIGGSDMLIGILDGVLEKIIKETVLQEVKRYGTSSPKQQQQEQDDDATTRMTPQQRLNEIDQAVLDVIEWEARRDQIEGLDVKSARDALNKNLLPEGVSMEDMITYREHEQRLKARTALQQELQRIEKEISVLKETRTKKQDNLRQQLGQVEEVERELEASANVVAMVTT